MEYMKHINEEKEDFIHNIDIKVWKYQNKNIQQKCDNKKKYLAELKQSVIEWETRLEIIKTRYRNGVKCCEEIERKNEQMDSDSYFEYITCKNYI